MTSRNPPPILTIAGSDSGGGAGIQADLKTIQALGGYGMSAITAVTAQNTQGVFGYQQVDLDIIQKQIELVLSDMGAAAIKTGMLANAAVIEVVAKYLTQFLDQQKTPLAVDPVMIAKGGAALLAADAVEALTTLLLPLATLITPNIPEAERLSGKAITTKAHMPHAAAEILKSGARGVIIKGGHLDTNDGLVHNLLMTKDGKEFWLLSPRIETKNTHGTGCTFSAALATYLAHGVDIFTAFEQSEAYVAGAIKHAPHIGKGHGPLNHWWMVAGV